MASQPASTDSRKGAGSGPALRAAKVDASITARDASTMVACAVLVQSGPVVDMAAVSVVAAGKVAAGSAVWAQAPGCE